MSILIILLSLLVMESSLIAMQLSRLSQEFPVIAGFIADADENWEDDGSDDRVDSHTTPTRARSNMNVAVSGKQSYDSSKSSLSSAPLQSIENRSSSVNALQRLLTEAMTASGVSINHNIVVSE